MRIRSMSVIHLMAVTMFLLTLAVGPVCAADTAPMMPEYAAKKENHRKQKEQQITHVKRQAAAEGLKAERLKVFQAKQARRKARAGQPDVHSQPDTIR